MPPKMRRSTLQILILLLTTLLVNAATTGSEQKPNIVIILADDLGFDDFGFHGNDAIPTPNIDALMTNGIALNRYYSAPMCSPARASLLTGKYPSTVGMQHFVIASEMPYGLGLNEKLLPEYMREGGYRTHIVGKWHLGFHAKEFTPMERGFDTQFGYLGPYIDYWNHSLSRINIPWDFNSGYDMRSNMTINYKNKGKYATDLLTDEAVRKIVEHDPTVPMFLYLPHLAPHTGNEYEPLQAPAELVAKFGHIADPKRRIFAAMVSALDTGVGKVVKALKTAKMLDNTIILFLSDNGAPTAGLHSTGGSNYPLRGQKDSPWEGAVRVGGAIWSKSLKQRQRVSNQLFHISDWLPTFARIAGVPLVGPVDGHDIWPALSLALPSPRTDVLLNLDPIEPYTSYIRNDWKYLNGTTIAGKYDGHLWENHTRAEQHESFKFYGISVLGSDVGRALAPYSQSIFYGKDRPMSAYEVERLRKQAQLQCKKLPANPAYTCEPLKSPCLFNVQFDPCERYNFAQLRPDIMKIMEKNIKMLEAKSQAPRNKPGDERSNPKYHNDTWSPWIQLSELQN